MAVSSDLSAVVFGLAASAAWGAGDFSGGMASRRAHTVLVVAAAHGIGLGLMVLLAVASAEALPSGETLFWGALAGIAGCLGLLAFWRGLSIGRMGLVAPVTAVIAVLVPVVVGMFTEGLPGVGKLIGFALALISLWLVSAAHNAGGERTGLGLAVFAGFGFGAFLALIGQVGKTSFFWSLTAARVASFSMMLIVVLTTRRTWQPNNRLFTWIVLAGVLEVAGNGFFVLATQSGRLDIASVLSSLYPAMTVLLARLVLKERVSRQQMVGVVTALAAIVLIAA
jgi:uncharacterized membrane protein